MSAPTTIATVRAGVLAAIKAVLDVPAIKTAVGVVPVFEGKVPSAWFVMNKGGNEAIVLTYSGEPMKERGPISRRDRQGLVYRFSIAVCAANWAEPVGATYKAADVGEYLHGSPTLPDDTPNLRTSKIATIHGQDVFLRRLDDVPTMAPNSTMEGGRFAFVQTWETDPEVRQ